MFQKISSDFFEDIVWGYPQVLVMISFEDIHKEIIGDIVRDILRDIVRDIPNDIPKDIPNDIPNDIVKDVVLLSTVRKEHFFDQGNSI